MKYGHPSCSAHIVDQNDVRVPQVRHRLGFALQPCPLVRRGVRAGDEHLEGDGAVKPEMPGLVDDAHAPAAEQGLHVIPRDPRELIAFERWRRFGFRRGRLGKERRARRPGPAVSASRARTFPSNSGVLRQTSSGVQPESSSCSSSSRTRGSSGMSTLRLLYAGRRSSSSCESSKSERFNRLCTVLAETPINSAVSA